MHRIIGETNNTGLFQYFIRVIPTIYTDEMGTKISTNQYTITDRFRPLIVPKQDIHHPPQVICVYVYVCDDILIFSLKYVQKKHK